jgi:peptidoglycan/LPS O-acetylase OafA/YrhL
MRGLSILLVLLEHVHRTRGFPRVSGSEWLLGKLGLFGVDVFFALSGFLITLLLLREHRKTGSVSLGHFYIRRGLRLMPAFAVYALTVFALTRIGVAAVQGSEWLHIFTYTVNFADRPTWEIGHLWSLSIEEQFYLLWPLSFMLLGRDRVKRVIIAWLLFAPLMRAGLLHWYPHTVGRLDSWTPMRLDTIAVGCLLAIYSTEPAFRARFATSPRIGTALALAFAAFIPLDIAAATDVAAYDVILEPSVRAVMIAALIWIAVNHHRTYLGRFLEMKPIVALGLLSYSIYLWQELFLKADSDGWARHWPANMLIVAAAGTASFLFVERPFLRLKERFERAPRPETRAQHPGEG